MQLFKSILDTSKDAALQQDNKRQLPRYPLGDSFPFRTKLTLFQKDGSTTPDAKGKDWSVTPVNLSAKGGSFQLSLAAVAFQRDPCRLKFSKGDYLIEIPGIIAHYRCYSQYSLCGILFNFPNAALQASYQQLLEPVIIGSTLVPVETKQDVAGWHKEQFGNDSLHSLIVWRPAPEAHIAAFELRMHNYVVRWKEGASELELYGRESTTSTAQAADATLTQLSEEQYEEVRWLFCYVVPNLPKAMPADIRKFFAAMVPK